MRWRTREESLKLEIENKTKWHKHFAWKPVRCGDQNVWLEFVYRKATLRGYDYAKRRAARSSRLNLEVDSIDYSIKYCWPVYRWEYRTDEFDMIKHPSGNTNNG